MSIDAAGNLMLRSVNNAAVVRLFWWITLDNLLFCLTRLLRSYYEIMASCRLHSQTLALCQCTEAMYCRFTLHVQYCRRRDVVGSNRSRFMLIIIAFQ